MLSLLKNLMLSALLALSISSVASAKQAGAIRIDSFPNPNLLRLNFSLSGGKPKRALTIDLEKIFAEQDRSIDQAYRNAGAAYNYSDKKRRNLERQAAMTSLKKLIIDVVACYNARGGAPGKNKLECYGPAPQEIMRKMQWLDQWETKLVAEHRDPFSYFPLRAFNGNTRTRRHTPSGILSSIGYTRTILAGIGIGSFSCQALHGSPQEKTYLADVTTYPYFCKMDILE